MIISNIRLDAVQNSRVHVSRKLRPRTRCRWKELHRWYLTCNLQKCAARRARDGVEVRVMWRGPRAVSPRRPRRKTSVRAAIRGTHAFRRPPFFHRTKIMCATPKICADADTATEDLILFYRAIAAVVATCFAHSLFLLPYFKLFSHVWIVLPTPNNMTQSNINLINYIQPTSLSGHMNTLMRFNLIS